MFLADCSGVSGSPGVYSIQVDPDNSVQAACLEGGWTVIQSRQGRTKWMKCRLTFKKDYQPGSAILAECRQLGTHKHNFQFMS